MMTTSNITKVCLFAAVIGLFSVSHVQAGCHRYSQYRPSYTRVQTAVVVNTAVVQKVTIQRTTVPSGSTLTVKAAFLQSTQGRAMLFVNELALPCKIQAWSDTQVTLELPAIGVNHAQPATLKLVKPDGTIGKTYNLSLTRPSDVVVHEEVVTVQ